VGITDLLGNALRNTLALFEDAGKDIERHSPLEEHLHEAVSALHRTADSLDKHVEVLEGITTTLPALTDVLAKLSDELAETLRLLRPIEAVEHEASGIARLFTRHHHDDEDAAPETDSEPSGEA
jgi:ABC-type transporter Mla subunit MlaD